MTKIFSVTVQLDQDLDDRVSAVAAALDQSKAWTIEQAVKDYVADQEWQLAAIAEGVRDADEGRLVDHDQVVAWIDSWGTETPRPPPECD